MAEPKRPFKYTFPCGDVALFKRNRDGSALLSGLPGTVQAACSSGRHTFDLDPSVPLQRQHGIRAVRNVRAPYPRKAEVG